MKLATENVILRNRFSDEESLRILKRAGFDGVDYSFCWADPPPRNMLGEDYLERASAIKRSLDELGLLCPQAHAPFAMQESSQPFDLSYPRYRDVVRSIEYASILGADCIVVHALKVPKEEELIGTNIRYYRSLEPYCRRYGIRIGVENIFGAHLDTPAKVLKIMEELGNENFTVCLDVGHSQYCGIPPQEFIRAMPAGLITALHVQDQEFGAEQDLHLLPYLSEIRWQEVMKALKEYGYSGWLNMEIFNFFNLFPTELLEEAARFAERTGRYLADTFDRA